MAGIPEKYYVFSTQRSGDGLHNFSEVETVTRPSGESVKRFWQESRYDPETGLRILARGSRTSRGVIESELIARPAPRVRSPQS